MHMSMMYEKRCYLAEPVVAGLEGVVSGSRVNPNRLLPARSCSCVSGAEFVPPILFCVNR